MNKNLRVLLTYTFGAIVAVIVLTNSKGFAQVIQSLAAGYKTSVGAFIKPQGR